MAIEIVLFDLGGVIIELGGMAEMAAFADESDEDEIWRRWLHCPWVRCFERGECDAETFATEMVREWSMPVDPETFLRAFATWPKGLLPGAADLIRDASRNRRIAALSNTNVIHAEECFAGFDFPTLFDDLYYSHEMGIVKPDRAAFLHVIEGLGCSPEQILFIDDNQINVEGARAAGLQAERTVGPDEARRVLAQYEVL